ncbi:DNA helicase [Tanacetum coccineum]
MDVGNTDMSERFIGQPVSTSAVNVGVLVQPVGDGLNEPARFSEQGVDSGRARRNVRRRFTPTESVMQWSVSRLSTGSRQRKRTRGDASPVENTRPRRGTRGQRRSASSSNNGGTTPVYKALGDCDQQSRYCGAAMYMQSDPEPPEYIKHLFSDKQFLQNIRAYNQMFAMTSFGAKIDESINAGRGPYVFKVSGQVYHWIGSMCPPVGEAPKFLQLYIYDTDNELFRTTKDKCREIDVPEFKIRLYNGAGTRCYELPASNTLGAIVFDSGPAGSTDFDVIIQERDGSAQRISKLHQSYMSLQFPLLFIYGQSGFHTELKLMSVDGSRTAKRVTMLAYYAYQLHPRHNQYNLIFRGGRLFQQYVVGLYDAISRGEREGHEVGGRIILPMSFTGGPPVLYNVEFQKRGLPHCHTLHWVDSASKIQSQEDVDRFISAELPDPNVHPRGYKIVSEMMMHGPCGPVNLSAQCMEANKCTKNFPKKFTSHAFFDDKGHVHYPRRDTKVSTTKHQFILDNGYVVPYNRDLLLAFVSYEIQNYLEGRFVCAHEAYWRIFQFDIHYRELAVQILAVHLENMQWVTFRDKERLEAVVNLPDFFEVQTIKNVFCPTCRAACEALCLLADDGEWDIAFEEACMSATSAQLRSVFCQMLIHCDVTDPSRLWTKYWEQMSHDIPGKVSEMTGIPNYHINDSDLEGYVLYELQIILNNFSKSLKDFGLLLPPRGLLAQLENKILMEERNYKRVVARKTTHSRFKVPLELTEESLCKITKNTHLAKLLADTNLIIWDEAPMNDRCCFEALDRSLRDILNALLSLFGGKSIVLGGDFWQTLHVKKGASKMEVIDISVDERNLINSFASWLLDVGDGKIEDSDEEDPENASWIDIPYRYCLSLGEEGLLKLIDFIYDESTLQTPSAVTLQQKAIVCPENETADMINSQVLKAVCGETTTYVSQDKATPVGNDGADTEMLNPVEHLNTLKFPRFPPHKLELKVGAPVMLLRNINLEGGLCNGTRMIVTQLMTKLIEVQIITGMRVGEKVFIHGISLIHKDPDLPFIFKPVPLKTMLRHDNQQEPRKVSL